MTTYNRVIFEGVQFGGDAEKASAAHGIIRARTRMFPISFPTGRYFQLKHSDIIEYTTPISGIPTRCVGVSEVFTIDDDGVVSKAVYLYGSSITVVEK